LAVDAGRCGRTEQDATVPIPSREGHKNVTGRREGEEDQNPLKGKIEIKTSSCFNQE
jgi:hypothetical protein